MKTAQCASCFEQLCVGGAKQEKDFCPAHLYPDIFKAAEKVYVEDPETRRMAKTAAVMESRGYIVWPRLKDIIEFSRGMKYKKMAVLFCPDLWREARKTCRILSENGFTVVSRVCGIGKSNFQAPEEYAAELNALSADIIVNAGLCVPFEARVVKLSNVPVSTFIARDRKLNNHPASAVYFSDKWRDWAKEVYRDKLGLK
jgi:uncharacterized metal-binding protein